MSAVTKFISHALRTRGQVAVAGGLIAYPIIVSLLLLTGIPPAEATQIAIPGAVGSGGFVSLIDSLLGFSSNTHHRLWQRELKRAHSLFASGVIDYRQAALNAVTASYHLALGPAHLADRVQKRLAKRTLKDQRWVIDHVLPLTDPQLSGRGSRQLDSVLTQVTMLSDKVAQARMAHGKLPWRRKARERLAIKLARGESHLLEELQFPLDHRIQ